VVDVDGNTLRVDISDPRYLSGELKFKLHDHVIKWVGKSHSEKTKLKMSKAKKGKYKKGENSQYGTYWITKNGINKKIKKGELFEYISNNWIKGRDYKNIIMKKPPKGTYAGEKNSQYGTKWVNNSIVDKKIKKSELGVFTKRGWVSGRIKIKKSN
jgi:hypothetical protein